MHSPHVSKSTSTASATSASTTTTVTVSGVSQPESAAGQHQQGSFVGLSTTVHTPESTLVPATYHQRDALGLSSAIGTTQIDPFEALATHQTVIFDDRDQGRSASSLSLSNQPLRSQRSSQPVDDIVPIVREEQSPDPTDNRNVMSGGKGCGRKYSQKAHLQIPFVTYTGDSKLRCYIRKCAGTVIYRDVVELAQHIQANHIVERPFGCELCNRRFRLRHHLKYHMKYVHGFEEEKNLQTHFATHTGNSKLRCYLGECAGTAIYRDVPELVQHTLANHTSERPFECELCDRRFRLKHHLKYHMKHVHCFEEKKDLQTYFVTPTDDSKLRCYLGECAGTVIYHGARALTKHTQANHTFERKVESAAGQRLRAPFMDLSTTVHVPEPTQTPKANQQLSGPSLLADVTTSKIDSFDDEAVTTGIAGVPNLPSDQYQAEQRPAPTNQWIIVDKSQERPYRCGYLGCDKSYLRRNHLIGHFVKHTGTSNFKCTYPECVGNEYFRDGGMLKRHIAIKHTRQKPFQCEFCDKQFHRKDRLRTHRENRHGIEEEKKPPKQKKK